MPSLRDILEAKKDSIVNAMSVDTEMTSSAVMALNDLLIEFVECAVENAPTTIKEATTDELIAAVATIVDPVLDLQLQMCSLVVAAFGETGKRAVRRK